MPIRLLKVTPVQVARPPGAGRQRVLSPPVIRSPPALGSSGEGMGAGCGLASCRTLAGQGGLSWSRKSLSSRSGVHLNLETLNLHAGL